MSMQSSKRELGLAAGKLEVVTDHIEAAGHSYHAAADAMTDIRLALQSLVLPLLQKAAEEYEQGQAKVGQINDVYKNEILPHLEASGIEGTGPRGQEFAARVRGIDTKLTPILQSILKHLYADEIFTEAQNSVRGFDTAVKEAQEPLTTTLLAPEDGLFPRMTGSLSAGRATIEEYAKTLDR